MSEEESHGSAPSAGGGAPFLAGGGELGALLRALDWRRTPLGPPQDWPQSLKTAVRIMLTSRQPIWIGWGEELTYLYNDPYKSIIGGKHPHALGQPTSAVWREIWDDIGPMLAAALSGDEGTYVEEQLLLMERNGYPEETYYTFSYSPIPEDGAGGGRAGGIICANSDDTRRVIGERQIALLRELAASTADARSWEEACERSARALATNPRDVLFAMIYIASPDGTAVSLAGSCGVRAGDPAAPVSAPLDGAPWPFGEVLRSHEPRLVAGLETVFGSALPTGAWRQPPSQAAALPIAATGDTGRPGVLVVGLNPFRLYDDNYQGFLSLAAGQISASLGSARAYEEERRRAETLAELDRAKTAFFSNVSHEFRTPLTLMLGPLSELLGRPHEELPAGDRELLSLVQRNGLRLQRLVNTLLEFSRLEAGRLQATYEPADLAALTRELASTFRSACEKAGLRLAVDCPPLPEPVYVDRDLWEKVVLNLLSNAFKFTLEGEIEVAVRAAGRHAELTVRDTGAGIPPEEMPRLFERFHRVEGTPGRTQEGSGIGLALVQELVRLHGGEVRAESEPGRGTTFTVALPFGRGHLPAGRVAAARPLPSVPVGAAPFVEEALRWIPGAAARPAADPAWLPDEAGPAAPARPGARPRVLLADDNSDMRDYIRRLLGEEYDVTAVADGLAALRAAREAPPDLVVTDVMMPGLDGFGLLRELRADPVTRGLPILMLSARAGEESRVEGMEAGADDYLVKPFSARELRARVTAHLQMARLRREAGESLRLEEERLRMALTAARMVAWRWDRAADCLTLSDNAAEVFGLPTRATLEQKLSWVHPDDAGHFRQTVARALQERGSFLTEFRMIRPDSGAVVWLEDRGYASGGCGAGAEPGAATRLAGVFMDITERKRSERLLEGQRHVLQMLAEAIPLGEVLAELTRIIEEQSRQDVLASVLLLDKDGRRLRLGAAPSLPEAYNRAIDGLALGPAVGSCGTAAFRREPVVAGDIASDPLWQDFAALALSHGLRACWSIPIFSSHGEVLGTFAMYYRRARQPDEGDVRLVELATRTAAVAIERKRAEDALRESERRQAELVRRIPAAVAVLRGPEHVFEFANERYKALIGDRDVVGKPLLEALPEIADQPFPALLDRVYATGEPFEGRGVKALLARTPGAPPEERVLDFAYTPLREPDGTVSGVAAYGVDLTERVRAEEALRRYAEALQDADRRKDEFLATLAHELRNPLAPIRNMLELMKRADGDRSMMARAHAIMERQLGHMVRLIDDLLDVSRISRGKIELRTERVELASVVQQAVEACRPLAESARQEIQVDLPAEPVYLNADPVRLAQVFGNILNNACKYTEAGGWIGVRAGRDGDAVTVAVRDTGIGIPPDQLDRIFEIFAQVDRTLERAQGGLGIGLTLVKRLVEMHGGTVAAHSDGPGRGSAFVVRLPVPAETPRAEPAAAAAAGPPVAAGRRILVVDDNRDSAQSLALLLEIGGHEVRTAYDGAEALELAAELRPDVVLMDLGMPKLNGYDAARLIRQQPWGGRMILVAVTGWGQEEDRRRTAAAGFDGHLVKPVDHARIVELIASLPERDPWHLAGP